VVSGVNLPMVLAFLNKAQQLNFERLPSELAARARWRSSPSTQTSSRTHVAQARPDR
jgi:mannose/fructose-specific phosphotransferase system component IIA